MLPVYHRNETNEILGPSWMVVRLIFWDGYLQRLAGPDFCRIYKYCGVQDTCNYR